jgi:uncharacterized repeat protein (TIGR02543 family)
MKPLLAIIGVAMVGLFVALSAVPPATATPPFSATTTHGTQTTSGGMTIITLTQSDTLVCTGSMAGATVLIVGGGGGGGGPANSKGGGGGGGGGVTTLTVTLSGSMLVTVGSAGAAGTTTTAGATGTASSFDSTTAAGGGGGATGMSTNAVGGAGACGGGGANGGGGGDGTAGMNGGAGVTNGNAGGGGGGGHNAIGADGRTSVGGDGGTGFPSPISGVTTSYADGGGGGGGAATSKQAVGGSGGGGTGGTGQADPVAPAPNRGGGGGGAGTKTGTGAGTAGAAGIVIISYPTQAAAVLVTFDSQGGSAVDPVPVVANTSLGTSMPVDPARNGYTFAGWYTGTNGSGTAFTSSTKVAGNITVTASFVDATPPTITSFMVASATSTSTVALSWPASTDTGSGVAGYRIYRNGSLAGTVTGLSYTDTVIGGATYTYYIVAYDVAGNTSAHSNSVDVFVPAAALSVSVNVSSVDMGVVDPGSTATKASAAIVTVSGVATQSYALTTYGSDFQVGSSVPTMPIGALQYQTSGQVPPGYRSFTTTDQTINTVASTGPGVWNQVYNFDYRLTVPWSVEPGVYQTDLLYTVTGS